MEFDIGYIARQAPALLRGLLVTIEVSAVATACSLALGLAGALCRHLRVPVLSAAVFGYVELIRNTPLLVQIFFVFFGLPTVGIRLDLFASGAVALTLWATAFQVENLRGGLASVGPGMMEAATALGMHRAAAIWTVALPIALRSSLPAVLNTCVSLLKNSSYLEAIGLTELTYVAVNRIASDFRTFEMLGVLLVAYLALVSVLSFAAGRLEARLSRPYAAA